MPSRVILLLALAAALLLFAAEFTTIASVDVGDDSCEVINDSNAALADRCELSGWERHGGALVLLALIAAGAGILAGRRDGSSAAAAMLVVIGVLALAIALIGDLPETSETGAIGRDFDGATAQAGLGFYLELTGGVLSVLAGCLGLLATQPARGRSGAQATQREAGEDLHHPTHDEADAGDQRERLEADVGIGDHDDPDGDPDHAEQRG